MDTSFKPLHCSSDILIRVPLRFRYKTFGLSDNKAIDRLKQKILGERQPNDVFPTVDSLFGMDPDEIPIHEFTHGEENEWFFFTTELRDQQHVTKNGYWRAGNLTCKIKEKESQSVIGLKRIMVFCSEPNRTKSKWSIHEYTLNANAFKDTELELDDSIKNKVMHLV
ncbi:NAC domain-containing protein 17 [Abeliophyllum distichum]|uniref:NAC domain-containing protein 17 n=1 Tax=Abeliophyllum distichum TaxID=126358 RepID=A0ABD1PFE6_9LAMI